MEPKKQPEKEPPYKGNVMIYVRKENREKWDKIKDKPKFLNEAIKNS